MKALDPTAVGLEGVALIEASAGTGKTHTITTLYLRLLLERGLEVAEILVVTYTNAATAELRDRIRRRLREMAEALGAGGETGDAALDALCAASRERGSVDDDRKWLLAGLRDFDQAAIFTIHGFCQRTLVEHAFECGTSYGTELVGDESGLFAETARDFWARRLYGETPVFLRHLRRRKMEPAVLEALAKKVVGDPKLPVLPEGMADSVEEDERVWRRALDEARSLWSQQGEEIIDLLQAAASDGVLKKNSYRPDLVASRWRGEMETALAVDGCGIAQRFAAFERFTPEGLEERTRAGQTAPEHAVFDACAALLEADTALEQSLDARLLQLQIDLVTYAREELPRRRELRRSQSFDDLLHGMSRALEGKSGSLLAAKIRERYPAALIDEFQDTDPVQYDIFSRVWRPAGAADVGATAEKALALFLIGDPKQAIYAFRGADVFSYLAAKEDAAEQCFTLGTNWRSDPSLIAAVNGLFARARLPFLLDRIPFAPVSPRPGAEDLLTRAGRREAPFELLFLRREGNRVSKRSGSRGAGEINKSWGRNELPDLVAAEVARFLDGDPRIGDRPVVPGDVALLCRTNWQTTALQQALRRFGITGVVRGDDSVFDAPEAGQLERVLRAMAEPGSASAVRRALATPILAGGGDKLLELAGDEAAWERTLESFRVWQRIWLEEGFVQAFHAMLRDGDVHARLLAPADGERRITNLLHLGELLHTASEEHHTGPEGLLKWLARMRADKAARGGWAAEAAEMRLESDAQAVQLVTVHKSKGLQYPIVYCPFLWDGTLLFPEDEKWVRFHDPDDDAMKLDLGSAEHGEHVARARWEALAENLRLVYVAVTRAQHRCSLVWGHFNETKDSALAYLLHQPGEENEQERGDLVEATRDRFEGLDDDELLADLAAVAAVSAGAIGFGELSEAPAPVYRPAREEAPRLELPEPVRRISRSWRISSFSGLAAARERAPRARPSDEGFDYDALEETGEVAARTLLAGPAQGEPAVRLSEFPAGAAPGTFLHKILEEVDFEGSDPGSLAPAVTDALERSAFDSKWREPLCSALSEVLATPIGVGCDAFPLSAVARGRRLDELEFVLPVASSLESGVQQPKEWRGVSGLLPEQLTDAFRRFGADERTRAYGDHLARLAFAPLTGHLRGFIDLVFEHAGRWYVVDYKSNHLGSRAADYAPERLVAPMQEHHYLLQYHLYVVALHRHLSTRLEGYDYQRHMGGVYYLFLRGMSPAHPAGCGVYRDRPPLALVEALSGLLRSPGESRAAGGAP